MSAVVVQTKRLHPLLAAYLQSLVGRPLLTKAVTSGVLSLISEVAAGELSGSPPRPLSDKERTGILPIDVVKRYHKALEMSAYGFFISAPLSHYLLQGLQRVFAGKTSARWKVLMIVCSDLLLSPLQQVVYITAMAIIGGARSSAEVLQVLRATLFPVMKLTWSISTACMLFAQKFLSPELWVPFFNLVGVSMGTYLNVQAKKRQLHKGKGKDAGEENLRGI